MGSYNVAKKASEKSRQGFIERRRKYAENPATCVVTTEQLTKRV
jgi:hypothetical protein